jgi:hypothetical protein
MDNDAFEWMILEKNASKYEDIGAKIQKEYILVSSIYNSKYEEFIKYISKFTKEQQDSIKKVIGHEQVYQDIDSAVYRAELQKWIKILAGNS